MELFAKFERMHHVGEKFYQLLNDGETLQAASLFEAETLELRPEITRAGASSTILLRDRIKRLALDVRLQK